MKSEMSDDSQENVNSGNEEYKPWGMDEKTFVVVLHLSLLAGSIIPLAGFILPILMWNFEKDNSKLIDLHGRVVLNWLISASIVGILFAILIITIPLLIPLGICSVVFSVIGAIKANKGQLWKYPLSIKFLSMPQEDDHSE